MEDLCPEEEVAVLLQALEGEGDDIAELDARLANYPNDPRLHFMKGSVLAGIGKAIEAHASLSRAVELAPEYHLARYQLGFFELTSGEADRALSTWGPLLRLPKDAYLRQFVEGLTAMIRDEFEQAIQRFEEGIALNSENAPMNADIELLLEQCRTIAGRDSGQTTAYPDSNGDEQSATSVLLGQFGKSPTRH